MAEGWNYRAKQQINFNGVPAYHTGDLVPDVNVEAYGYLEDGLVEHVDEDSSEKDASAPSPDAGAPADGGANEDMAAAPSEDEKQATPVKAAASKTTK